MTVIVDPEPHKELTNYERLASINVNAQVEKKGGLSYLSWAWAVDRLLREDPEAEWSYRDILYLQDRTALVFCTVTAFGKARTMQLPVMDYKNRAIADPDSFAINTAMQRALVKAIALHGLGLYIYAGEDLPPSADVLHVGRAANDDAVTGAVDGDDIKPKDPKRPNTATQVAVDAFDDLPIAEQKYLRDLSVMVIDMVEGGDDAHGYIESKGLSTEQRLGLWSLLPSHTRTALQKAARPQVLGPRTKGKTPAPTPTELGSQP